MVPTLTGLDSSRELCTCETSHVMTHTDSDPCGCRRASISHQGIWVGFTEGAGIWAGPFQWLLSHCHENQALLLESWIKDWRKKPWVVWLSGLSAKGLSCQFDSQSGHMPGLWARSPVGGAPEATIHWCFSPSLSPSFPLSLKINK